MTGEQLKKYRQELHLTQAQLARELCVTRRAVVSWETNSRNMPLPVEKLFCLLYDLPFMPCPDALLPDDRHPDLF